MQAMRSFMNRQKNLICKNGKFSIETVYKNEPNKDNVLERKPELQIENTGCKNPRRNGSAFCQECADKYNQNK